MTRSLLREKNKQEGIAIIFRMIAVLLFFSFFVACEGEKREFIDLSAREKIYLMKSTDFSALVSDSGIVKYKAEAAELYMYDDGVDPYLYFPQKVHLEQYDSLFQVTSSIDADTAYNYTKRKLWKAIGNVVIESVNKERFETSEIYWDEQKKEIYSEKFIKITKGDYVNTGVGFTSNQSLTQYRIYQSGAEIPIGEPVADTTNVENTPPL